MKINILTLFPQMFEGPFNFSILKRAILNQKIEINFIDIRKFGIGKHKIVDGKAFGGGVGMILRADVIDKALLSLKENKGEKSRTVLLDARGESFKQAKAKELSSYQVLNLICGHYEGFDERIRELVDETISIGDFILTGGELAAMLITDSVVRLMPGILKDKATSEESFSLKKNDQILLEYPQYTLPRDFKGKRVPEILLSGNHKKIGEWQEKKALEITKENRPDMIF